ncbi:MAG TPA: hypothetical protein VIR60_02870 [Gammaproteobacteria bacterium]
MLSPREKKRLLDTLVLPDEREPGHTGKQDVTRDQGSRKADPQPLNQIPTAQRRSVVLGVGESLSLPALDYAAGACARLDAGLILLCADAALTKRLFEPHLSRLSAMGVTSRVVALNDPLPGAVADFMQNDPGVLFAVTAGNDPIAALAHRSGKGSHKAPPAPIVMVSDASPEHPDTLEFRRFKRGTVRN